jgi:hypothetical protein
VAQAVAARDADRAEQIARSITDPYAQGWALSAVTQAVAARDADRAEQIARSITDPSSQAEALSAVAQAVAARDADRAEQVARSITDPDAQAEAFSLLVMAVDPSKTRHRARIVAAALYGGSWIQQSVLEALASVDQEAVLTLADRFLDEVYGASESQRSSGPATNAEEGQRGDLGRIE